MQVQMQVVGRFDAYEKNGRRSRIVLSYELTEEQKQQYVDASIQMLLK